MALQMNVTDDQTGLTITGGYVRIMRFQTAGENRMEYAVGYYKDQAARQADKAPVLVKSLIMESFDHAAVQSSKKQLYAHMKTLPEFTGATDVPAEP